MAGLNQAKVMKDLEAVIAGNKEEFIWGFLAAYKFPKTTIRFLRNNEKDRNVAKIDGDIALTNNLYFRVVTDDSSVENALEEIKELPLIEAEKIRFILITDYQHIYAYDKKVDDYTEFDYADLPVNYEFFLPLTKEYEKPIAYIEHPADVKACEKMGRLYDRIRTINHYEKEELHTLNIFLTHLLFCFFAEDAQIFPQSQQMTNAITANTLQDGSDTASFFENLFSMLDLPENAPERKNFPVTFQKFPYVNGTLFRDKLPIPQFDKRTRNLLLDCGKMNWSDISPVIFGSMFQIIMDQEKRRNLGAHYTSEENILKVIRPLFLDDLEEEFEKILIIKTVKAKEKALKEFHQKLYSLRFLDPACGCGNFLIVSYRELRLLELKVLRALKELNPQENQWLDIKLVQKVSIEQFYGIEIEEFPVDIARVSLFLMEHVMNLKCAETFGQTYPSIPLKHSATIVCTNALTTPWESIVLPEKINFIFGNPPFVGARKMNEIQKKEILKIYHNTNGAGNLDYVCAWFQKSSYFIESNLNIKVAFVATNSISQGEQVSLLWEDMFRRNISITFAYQTFKWNNEAKNKAAVFCVIIGFEHKNINSIKKIYLSNGVNIVKNISPYLFEGSSIFIKSRNHPLCNVKNMEIGNQAIDDGNYIFSLEEMNNFIKCEPNAEKYFKKWLGSYEIINKKRRYCLFLGNCSLSDINSMPLVLERTKAVEKFRKKSDRKATNKLSSEPHKFLLEKNYDTALIIPRVSSERRKYIPLVFVDNDSLVNDSCLFISNASLYDFAILTSAMHMAWMRAVSGRLKSDYRYSASVVYNTFPFPYPTEKQKVEIEKLAEEILLIRETYPELTLADMYAPDKMPENLKEAHYKLDYAVDSLYQRKPFENDDERLLLLFSLYEKLTKENPEISAGNDEGSEEE